MATSSSSSAEGQAIPLAQGVWEATPLQSREFIVFLMGQIATLTQQILTLQKRLEAMEVLTQTNSTNSSKPPSADPPGTLRNRKETSGKSRGGQPGHKGHHREMLPTGKADHVRNHYPPKCAKCSRDLTSADAVMIRIGEIPPVKAEVTEHQRHRCCCPDCPWPNCHRVSLLGPLALVSLRWRDYLSDSIG